MAYKRQEINQFVIGNGEPLQMMIDIIENEMNDGLKNASENIVKMIIECGKYSKALNEDVNCPVPEIAGLSIAEKFLFRRLLNDELEYFIGKKKYNDGRSKNRNTAKDADGDDGESG